MKTTATRAENPALRSLGMYNGPHWVANALFEGIRATRDGRLGL